MIVDFSVAPIGKGVSLSSYVARVFRLIEASELPFEHHAMGTNVEGDWDDVMDLIKRCRDELLKDCSRVTVSIRIDDRQNESSRLHAKVASAFAKMR